MVVQNNEIMSPGEVEVEVESPIESDEQQNRPQLSRQSSIYSLTLDEFQHTVNESGKNFGSMNMDEFLNSIWTAEELQAQTQTQVQPLARASASGQFLMAEPNMIARQQSLSRQGSLALPGSLSRKTVDEVWSEIRRAHEHDNNRPSNENTNINNNNNNSGCDRVHGSAAQRQPTYGEMTLEDFLVKAGVVREQNHPSAPVVQPQAEQVAPFGLFNPNGNNRVVGPPPGSAHMVRPIPGGDPVSTSYPVWKQTGSYQPQPPPCYPGMVVNGGGEGLGIGSPASPVSSDGITMSQLDSGNQYGVDIGGVRGGRNRIIDGPVEKVVERRQRRMIKNRESAARSRARKQAYTVELEAELNLLKEENAQLKQAMSEVNGIRGKLVQRMCSQ
ncbi:hypothetical protein M8C21_028036 [Ambrosia artemisiifolia]|uniref:BZIP domain-containing protein n=1 Tax=Ambrosia artemisiifolia TaxID=4212 RepID=A0AAD5CEF2_AMBAR|nr:hypothetical protein M8C21_028036 [Ambrosia artemisiifolia]